ncbi:Isopentenyldiphosphate isomerase [Piromyces finnis]|uniref:isopentenyl-diphosphate Delta-isomerase n=1 Tax=Piromyces finnis TaxID=1754191 RepID=A0A1Y1VC04_9FUNG|nr:Isopentenyldiphosphate isomerase [Piromyces finnis]|eukprot:ORX52512.1 Isopentenyldiphosphate isomerase [Piromyces finnis]
MTDSLLTDYDAEQARLMQEMCIIVDENDKRIGAETKKNCHLMENINRTNILHRAFSVFLFDKTGERLLLQQRAKEKITFPEYFTNTCCSHPLNIKDELKEDNQLGAKNAAIRKLEHELGIPQDQINIDDIHFLTRIHYLAPSDGIWGEHEIDYIFIIKADVELNVNPNEVMDIRYVTKDELRKMFKNQGETGVKLTPWFQLIVENFLYKWWDNIDNLDSQKDMTIHRLI